jgi:hypothetical protein
MTDRSELIDQLGQMRRMIADANDSPHPELVFIVSLGDPSIGYYNLPSRDGPDTGVNQAVQQLTDQVEQLGGTRNAFYKTLTNNDPNSSYTLVSLANSGGGRGDEALQRGPFFTNVPLNTTPISGTLAPAGPAGTFEVQGTPRMGPEASGPDPSLGAQELSQVAFQSPTPWPEQNSNLYPDAADRARKQAAIGWIGNKVLGTPDIRGQYWTYRLTQSGGFDVNHWTDVGQAIHGLTYPSDVTSDSCPATPPSHPGFCPGDLEWAQTELAGPESSKPPSPVAGEIGWLINTNDYLGALAEPFKAGTQLTSWADLHNIAESINSKVNVPASTPITKINFTAIFDFARGILEVAPEVGEAVIALNTIYDLVSDITEVEVGHQDVPAGDDFSAKESEMGVELAKRMDAAQEMLNRGLPNVIASDYGKLSVVGACSATVLADPSQCPYPLSDWQPGQDDQKDARDAFINSTRAWAYSQLLPVKYSLFQLPDWWQASVSDNNDFYRYPCGADHSACNPFNGEPATAQFAKPIYRNMPTYAHTLRVVPFQARSTWESSGDTWRIYALGQLDKSNPDDWKMGLPGSEVTDKLFQPINKNDLIEGPLGVDPETFFDRYFTPVPLEHYPTTDYDMGWCQNGHQPCGGQQPPFG